MLANRVKGNHKDYVIITGSRLMDWSGSYDIRHSADGKIVQAPASAVALIHKSKLRNVIGEEAASAFWRTSFGRVPPSVTLQQMNIRSSGNLRKIQHQQLQPEERPPEDKAATG